MLSPFPPHKSSYSDAYSKEYWRLGVALCLWLAPPAPEGCRGHMFHFFSQNMSSEHHFDVNYAMLNYLLLFLLRLRHFIDKHGKLLFQ